MPEGSGLIIELTLIVVIFAERVIVIVCELRLMLVSEGWVVMLDVSG